jgi:hypothetical protein
MNGELKGVKHNKPGKAAVRKAGFRRPHRTKKKKKKKKTKKKSSQR